MRNLVTLFAVFLFTPAFLSAQYTASDQVVTFIVEAPTLDKQKKIWLYLPRSYGHSKSSYPVFYMHDAQNLFDTATSYAGEWKIDEYLDSITDNEIIVVGIEHGNENRIDELTPFNNNNYGGGRAIDYLRFIVDTLKPFIDTNYRTLRNAENTVIFGSSLGGLVSLYALVKHPEVFGKAGVFSPSLWFSDRIYDFVGSSTIDPKSELFMLSGTDESETTVTHQNKMADLLRQKGMGHDRMVNRIIEGGQHNEAFWSKYFPEAHQWLMSKKKK
jgi:predicted alpha/beta superfamily hydrolase